MIDDDNDDEDGEHAFNESIHILFWIKPNISLRFFLFFYFFRPLLPHPFVLLLLLLTLFLTLSNVAQF